MLPTNLITLKNTRNEINYKNHLLKSTTYHLSSYDLITARNYLPSILIIIIFILFTFSLRFSVIPFRTLTLSQTALEKIVPLLSLWCWIDLLTSLHLGSTSMFSGLFVFFIVLIFSSLFSLFSFLSDLVILMLQFK